MKKIKSIKKLHLNKAMISTLNDNKLTTLKGGLTDGNALYPTSFICETGYSMCVNNATKRCSP